MTNHIRELNSIELTQISGGIPIGQGGHAPTLPIDDLGDSGAFIPVSQGGGGRDWWKLPGGGIDPVVPVPKPEPGKP